MGLNRYARRYEGIRWNWFFEVAAMLAVSTLIALVACGPKPDNEIHGFGSIISPTTGALSLSSMSTAVPGTEAGQQLTWNGTAYAVGKAISEPSLRYYYLEEFEGGTACTTIGKFTVGGVVGASTCAFSTEELHPGKLTITSPATATDGARIATANGIVFGNVPWQAKALIKIHNVGSAVDQYLVRVGFNEPLSTSADSVDAVQAVYQFSATGAFWALETSSNSTRTLTICNGSGGTVAAPVNTDTWYTLQVNINAAGTAATLSVGGTVCATNTTNIPTTSTRATAAGLQFFNDTGSTPIAQFIIVDYIELTVPFGVAR